MTNSVPRNSEPEPLSGKPVWDLGIRAFHGVLVLLVTAALWLGHFGPIIKTWHVWAGYGVIALLAFRVVWGFLGGRHALFRTLLYPPSVIIAYARTLPRRHPSYWQGHNPLGGLATIAGLALLAFQAATGLFADDEIFSAGPLAGLISEAGRQHASALHAAGGWLVIGFILMHLAAVLFYAVWKRENLVQPMITGRAPPSGDLDDARPNKTQPAGIRCRSHDPADRKGPGRDLAAAD